MEREALALVYAVKKFHSYLYGRSFELQTDHKPLLKIFGSKTGVPVHTANRLRRYALTLMGYDFKINYVQGENFAYADFVSRLIDGQAKSGTEDIVIASIRKFSEVFQPRTPDDSATLNALKALPISLNDLKQASSECDHLRKVISHVRSGWPQRRKQFCDLEAAEYFTFRQELQVISDCLFFKDLL